MGFKKAKLLNFPYLTGISKGFAFVYMPRPVKRPRLTE